MDDIKNLQKDHTYLIRYGNHDTLYSITVLLITDKAYHLRWNTANSNNTWETKEFLYRNYNVVEDISDFIIEKPEFKYDYVQQPQYHITTKYVTCPNCGGSGQVDDFMTTAGKKTCPRCWGSGNIPEIVEVTQK